MAGYSPLFNVVLHQPEIPYNTGGVGRTCVAVGAKLWLVRPLGFRVDDSHLRRSGMDYWQRLEWEVVDDWSDLVKNLSAKRVWLFTKTALRSYLAVEYQPGDAIVFGSESQGLPPSILRTHADQTVRIPMRAGVRSLNLSSSVAVASYEVLRQLGAVGRSAIIVPDSRSRNR